MGEKRRSKGRPPKLTLSVQNKICEGLSLGMGYEQASLRSGITDRTRQNWVNTGKELYLAIENEEGGVDLTSREKAFLRFFLAHEAAVAESQYYHLTLLENHAQTDPGVSKWILERRFPLEFGGRTRIEHSGPEGSPIEIAEKNMPVEKRAAEIILILEAAQKRKEQQEKEGDGADAAPLPE